MINIRDLFGVASTRTSKRVELVVQLERWDPVARVRPPGPGRKRLRAVRREGPAHPHAGGAGAEPGDPRRSGGAEPAAAIARAATRRAISLTRLEQQLRAGRRRRRRRGRRAWRRTAMMAADADAGHGAAVGRATSAARDAPAVRDPDRALGFGEDARDPRARGPRLLLRRQPAEAAHSDVRGAVARGDDAGLDKVAIVVDVREGGFLKEFPQRLPPAAGDAGRRAAPDLSRGEPLGARAPVQRDAPAASAGAGPFGRGRASTRSAGSCNAIRSLADLIIDTSNLTVHELRDIFMRMSRDDRPRPRWSSTW